MTRTAERGPSLERRAIALWAVATLVPVVVCGVWTPLTRGLGLEGAVGPALLGVVASATVSLGWRGYRWLAPRIPTSFDGKARAHKVLAGLWLLTALAAFVQTTRLSVFMADPTRTEASMVPGSERLVRHTCLSAYVHGAKLAEAGDPNVYQMPIQPGEVPLTASLPEGAEYLGQFTLDPYEYPPPFLILPRAMTALTGDFVSLRALWFMFGGLVSALGLFVIAWWLGGRAQHHVIKLAPLVWVGMPLLVNLQLGNFQLAVVFITAMAMIAFDRQRHALGGAMLAFVALSKFAPGLLGVVLLAQRRYRAAVWTIGAGAAWIGLSFLIVGSAPWHAFFDHKLAAIQSAEVLRLLGNETHAVTNNLSMLGLPLKLAALGIGDMGLEAARTFGNVYSALLLVAAWWLGRDQRSRAWALSGWIALLTLGAMRSPFAPPHILIGAVVVLCVASHEVKSKRQLAAVVVTWIALTVVVPIPFETAGLVVSLVRHLLLIGLLTWLVVGRGGPVGERALVPETVAAR